jgi:hypothetical protein
MSFKAALGIAVVVLVTGSLTPALAHHAHGNYQQTYVDMEGKVTEVHIIVPHPWIYIEVVRDGQKKLWALEGGGRRDQTVKPGDTIKVRCHPLRDGNAVCLLGFLKAADGSVMDWDGKEPPPKDF